MGAGFNPHVFLCGAAGAANPYGLRHHLGTGALPAVAYMFLMAFSVLAVVTLLDKDRINPVYKLMWVTIITMMPPMGALFYLFWGHRNTGNRHARRMEGISGRITHTPPQDPEPLRRLRLADQGLARSAQYLIQNAGAPFTPIP